MMLLLWKKAWHFEFSAEVEGFRNQSDVFVFVGWSDCLWLFFWETTRIVMENVWKTMLKYINVYSIWYIIIYLKVVSVCYYSTLTIYAHHFYAAFNLRHFLLFINIFFAVWRKKMLRLRFLLCKIKFRHFFYAGWRKRRGNYTIYTYTAFFLLKLTLT